MSLASADGDMSGDMIVSYTGYAVSLRPCFSPSLSLNPRLSPSPYPPRQGYNASGTYVNAFGTVQCCGAKLDGVSYVAKLSKTDGSEVWKHPVPHALSQCRTISDGSFRC